MKIYHLILLSTEIDILDLTLHELDSIVDKFIILEYPFDYGGRQRKMYYNENKERFKKFEHKILHIIDNETYDGALGVTLLYVRLNSQMLKNKLSFIEPDDFLITTDGDAFLMKKSFDTIDYTKPMAFAMKWNMYWFNYITTDAMYGFTQAAPYKFYSDSCRIKLPPDQSVQHYGPAGYHFAKCGGLEMVLENTRGYPHQEFAVDPDYIDPIQVQERIDNGWGWSDKSKGIDKRNWNYIYVDYDPTNYPEYLNQHPEIYKKYFCFTKGAKNLGNEGWQK
jgi:hypothetical protein